MTPLHNPPVTFHPTSHTPLASNQDYAAAIQKWVEGAPPGEDRITAANKILHANGTNSAHLKLSNFDTLTTLPTLPPGLTSLKIAWCISLKTLPENLPAGLIELHIHGCNALTTLPENLPAGLTTLDFFSCDHLTTLPPLPAGLTTLNIANCNALMTLLTLPAGLIKLDISLCNALITLPENLPAGLTWLNISWCGALTTLPNNLPAGLTMLSLMNCHALTTLPEHLPDSLTKLILHGCRALTTLPESLPDELIELHLYGCSALTTLPEHLPDELIQLNLSGCHALTDLPANLPTDLTTLNLTDCHALTALPVNLPARLTRLNITGCHALTTLPANLPQHLVIYGHQPVLTPINILTQWCQRDGKSETYIADINNEWQKLQNEDGFKPFAALIRRLEKPELLNSISPEAIIKVIEAVIQSPDIRRLIFAASREADENCHDRRLTIFNTVQGLARFATLQRENATPQTILDLAIGMVKQAVLDEATLPVIQRQWEETPRRHATNAEETGPNVEEALETQLALRHELCEALNLPFPVNNPF